MKFNPKKSFQGPEKSLQIFLQTKISMLKYYDYFKSLSISIKIFLDIYFFHFLYLLSIYNSYIAIKIFGSTKSINPSSCYSQAKPILTIELILVDYPSLKIVLKFTS